MTNDEHDLIDLTQELLTAIVTGDWLTYERLCDPTLTAFEPEAPGALVAGMNFHRFYFPTQPPNESSAANAAAQATIVQPHVRVLGETAVVSYVRVNQRRLPSGEAVSTQSAETRVWHRSPNGWRQVHFHRTALETH